MVKTSSVENVEKYTKIFEGASLVNLDELPISGTSKTLQDTMKALITEPKFDCRAMFNQAYSQDNTFNFVITSNNNCILLTQTNQIRYYVNTINESYIGKKEYFDELHNKINNEDVKILIFQEFVKIFNEKVKPTNWIGNDLKPTKAGQIKRIEALPPFYKWIKETYLLKGVGIDEKCSDLFSSYKKSNSLDKTTQNKLARYLHDLGISMKEVKKTNDEGKQVRECRKYVMPFETLKTIYENKGWIDDMVDELPDESNVDEIEEFDSVIIEKQKTQIEELKKQVEHYKNEKQQLSERREEQQNQIEEQKNQIEELKKQMKELQQQQLQKKKIVKKKFIVENEGEDDLIIHL